jgi:hypothetical protein
MLTLPIPDHPPLLLGDSTLALLAKATESGLDGTSDQTAVLLPPQFTSTEYKKFFEFVFHTRG